MSRELWLNLPVREPERAKEFYKQLGFRLNEKYVSQDGSFSLIVGDNHISGRSPLVSRVIARADGNAVLPTVLVVAVPRRLELNREGIPPIWA